MFTMYDYLEDILSEAPTDFDGDDVTPAVSNLFSVDLIQRKLGEAIVDLFHCIVTRFLYMAKRARPDLQGTVAFLCKRVKCHNVDDWKKLLRLVRYVRATIHLPLIVGLDGSSNLVWSIDASFAVHMDMESHTGFCLSLGIGSHISGSSTQKVNTKSLTKKEPVGVDDAIGFVEWTSLYNKEQVKEYQVEHSLKDLGKKNVVLQDNTSTIKLLKSGRRVCRSRTRSIHIRYFYAHERVKDETIVVIYCPTKEMVSDYLSKPLQGSLFRAYCNTLMGISSAEEVQYKLAYAKVKALRTKVVIDHLSI